MNDTVSELHHFLHDLSGFQLLAFGLLLGLMAGQIFMFVMMHFIHKTLDHLFARLGLPVKDCHYKSPVEEAKEWK